MRQRDVDSDDVECLEPFQRARNIAGTYVKRHVDVVQPGFCEGGVVHLRRTAMFHRCADYADDARMSCNDSFVIRDAFKKGGLLHNVNLCKWMMPFLD